MGEESGLSSEWRGLTVTVSGKWGNPEYLAFDVQLEDGRTQLFWHHESPQAWWRFLLGGDPAG